MVHFGPKVYVDNNIFGVYPDYCYHTEYGGEAVDVDVVAGGVNGGVKAELPQKPRQYLEELEIGFDHGIVVPADHVDAFRIAASRLKMRGMKFKSRMNESGINMWRVS